MVITQHRNRVAYDEPADKYWELCMTINDPGYQQNDRNFKSSEQIIKIFAECLSKGGTCFLTSAQKLMYNSCRGSLCLERSGEMDKKALGAIYVPKADFRKGVFMVRQLLAKTVQCYIFCSWKPRDR